MSQLHSCLSHMLACCRYRYSDVVLVVMFNVAFPGWLEVHKQISAAYKPLFRQIVYTGFHLQVIALRKQRHVPQPAIAQCPGYTVSMASPHLLDRAMLVDILPTQLVCKACIGKALSPCSVICRRAFLRRTHGCHVTGATTASSCTSASPMFCRSAAVLCSAHAAAPLSMVGCVW